MPPDDKLEQQRQIVYTTVLRYASEALPLRERVLERVVLGALSGSTEGAPFRVETIQSNLYSGAAPLRLRSNVIAEALGRLTKKKLVHEHPSARGKPAYHITAEGAKASSAGTDELDTLFDRVFARTFAGTEGIVPKVVASVIFRTFAFRCFARYGRVLAQSALGQLTSDEIPRLVEAHVAFDAAVEGVSLQAIQRETLANRCSTFLTDRDALSERLRVLLAQGYYFGQLLEIDAPIDLLSDHAFKDTVFYIDTNVLLPLVFPGDVEEELFTELLGVARKAGASFRVTRATLDELTDAIAYGEQSLRAVADLPQELLEQSSDTLARGFAFARKASPKLTVEEYLDRRKEFEGRIREEWKVEIDERTAAEILNGVEADRVRKIMAEEVARLRGPKNDVVMEHDVAHYVLVIAERKKNVLTWFLTRDRTIPPAAKRLAGANELPFSYSLLPFLQSISPFAVTPSEQYSFVDVFGSLMSEHLRPVGAAFDMGELRILAEFHGDVMATPSNNLIPALEYVKTRTLHGETYTKESVPDVSLALKKFLHQEHDQQVAALKEEAERLRAEMDRQSREHAEVLAQERAALTAKEEQVQAEATEKQKEKDARAIAESDAERLRERISDKDAREEGRLRRNRIIMAAIGVVAAIFVATKTHGWVTRLCTARECGGHDQLIEFAVRAVAALILALPAFRVVSGEGWSENAKVATCTVIGVVALAATGLFGSSYIGQLDSMLGPVGLLVILFFLGRRSVTAR